MGILGGSGIKIERHGGELAVKAGRTVATRAPGKREQHHGNKPWAPAVSGACAKRQHGKCFRRLCTCECHKAEREATNR